MRSIVVYLRCHSTCHEALPPSPEIARPRNAHVQNHDLWCAGPQHCACSDRRGADQDCGQPDWTSGCHQRAATSNGASVAAFPLRPLLLETYRYIRRDPGIFRRRSHHACALRLKVTVRIVAVTIVLKTIIVPALAPYP